MEISFTAIIDLIGSFAFAISGIKLAMGRQIDLFGAYVIGLVTAVGGGTTRDLLLDRTPFWMLDGKYLLTTAFALVVTLVLRNKLNRWTNTLLFFDAIGLGLFTVVGITISLQTGLPIWVCIIMGAVTGSIGGVIRDVLLNEVPLLFRKDIYSLACIAGGIMYFLCVYFNLSRLPTEFIAASTVIVIRIIAIRFHIHLPVLRSDEPQKNL